MWFGRGIDANGAVVRADFAQNATFHERMQRLINGRKRNAGNLPANYLVNLFGTRMARSRHQRVVDNGALMRDSETMPAAEFTKVRMLLELHLVDWM